MLKLVAALWLLTLVSSEEEVVARPPDALTAEDKLKKVKMPTIEDKGALQSVNKADCLDKKLYHDIDELLKVENEGDYLCAYISYQANKRQGVGIPAYSDEQEATKRYTCFKQTVDLVNDVNGGDRSYTLEVNKFADMTPLERSRYLGLGFQTTTPPDSCDGEDKAEAEGVGKSDDAPVKLGNAAPGGFGNAAPGGFGNAAPGGFGNAAPGGFGSPPGDAPPRGFGNPVGGAPPRGFGA